MFSPYMPYSGEQGLVTNDQNVVLLLVFSEPVNGLTASSFSISGPSGATVSGLKLLRGTNTYYHFTVNLPGTYYDAVTVNLQVRLACCTMPAAVCLSHTCSIFTIHALLACWSMQLVFYAIHSNTICKRIPLSPLSFLPAVDPSLGLHMLDEQQSLLHLQSPQCIHVLLFHAGYSNRHSWKSQPGCQPLELYQSGVSTAVWHIV